MPIKQQRMLDLLSAAKDYQQALERAERLLAEAQRKVNDGQHEPSTALLQLAILLRVDQLLLHPLDSPRVIGEESVHFAHVAKRNESRLRRRHQRQSPDTSSPPPATSHQPVTATPTYRPHPLPVETEQLIDQEIGELFDDTSGTNR